MAELVVPFAKREAAEALAQGEAAGEKAARLAALSRFAAAPVETSPLFVKHVMTEGAPLSAVEVIEAPAAGARTAQLVDGGLDARVRIADGAVEEVALSARALAQGLTVHPLREHPEGAAQVDAFLAAAPNRLNDKFAELARALYRDGVLIDVPEGVKLEGTLRLDFEQRARAAASFARVLVRLGARASAEVVEVHSSTAQAPAVFGLSVAAAVGPLATLRYNGVANTGPDVGLFLNREAVVAESGVVQWGLGNFGGALTKSLTHTCLSGDDSSVKHTEVVFGARAQRFDVSSFATHVGRRAKSDVLARAALRHQSRGHVKGMITITNRGLEADSYLGQFALLLDRESKAVAIPGLEIETSQVVRAKHAAAVQQVDDSQVFYLESRGIPEQEARRLIVEGFLYPVIASISSPDLREEVHGIVRAKWAQS